MIQEQNTLYLRKEGGGEATAKEHARLNAEAMHQWPGSNYIGHAENGTIIASTPKEEHKEEFFRILKELELSPQYS